MPRLYPPRRAIKRNKRVGQPRMAWTVTHEGLSPAPILEITMGPDRISIYDQEGKQVYARYRRGVPERGQEPVVTTGGSDVSKTDWANLRPDGTRHR